MDEAYASPSSDGHATLPSPTDSTFDLSLLPPPRKRRNRTAEAHVPTSSFINHAPTSHDSSSSDGDDEGDGDETFLRGTLPWGDGYQRMLPSSPEELHRNGNGNESSNGNGNGNGDGGEQKGAEPRRLLLREREAFGARTGNGRRASPPPRLALGQSTAARGAGAQKPQEDEKAMAGETSHAGAVVDESIVRPPATTAGSTTIKDVTSTAIVPAGTSRHQQTNETEPQSPPPPPPPNANRRSLVSQGPGIEPQYPIAGNVYGRRKGPGNGSSVPPGGDAPLGATSQGPANAGGANRGNEGNKVSGSRSGTPLGTAPGGSMGAAAPEQKPQSAKEDGNGNGNGNDNGNGRNKAPEQRPQPTTSDANNARNKAPEPRAAGDRPSTPPAESTAPALPSTTPAGEPPTAPPIPLPAPIPQPPARPLDPHTPANKPPRKHPALALAPAPIPIPHPLLLRRRSTSPQKRRPNPDADQEPELPPPQQPRSQPASPDSFLGKTPRYLNWLNSSMDEGHGGSPPGHRQRLREALAQRAAPDESGFVGGDEDSSDDEDVDEDGDGEIGGGGEGQRSFSDGDEGGDGGLEERGLAAVSEEGGAAMEMVGMRGVWMATTTAQTTTGGPAARRAGAGEAAAATKTKRRKTPFITRLAASRRPTRPTASSSLRHNHNHNHNTPHHHNRHHHHQQQHPQSPARLQRQCHKRSRERSRPPPMAFDPTMPQFFSDPPAELPSPEPPVKKVKPRPPPLTTTTTTTTTNNNNNISNIIPARPSIAEIHKVPPPRSTTLIGKKSFNDLLLTSPTSPTSATSATSPSSPAAAETDNPPDFSSLGSGFSFESIPARYKSGHEFTPLGAKVMGSSVASEETVGKGGAGGGEDRKRSKSDPVEIKAWMESKGLVVPMRVGETKEEKDRRSFSEEEEEQPGRSVLGEGYSEGESESEGARGNRHWAALQDFHQSSSSTTAAGAASKAPAVQDDADPRAHTPASINESKDLISELEGSSKTLWVRMAQAEAENNHFRKLLESNNIKIDDSFHDLSSSNLDVRPPAPDDSFDASTSEDVGSLRRRVMELEALLEIVARKEMDLRAENERKDNLVMHWRNQYNDVQKLALQNRQRALGLESQVKALEQRAAAEIANHGREINKVVSKLTERSDVIKNTRQKSLGLEDRLAATEGQLRDARDALDERERTITQLRQALERRCAFSGGEGSAESLQEKLIEQQQAHDADTAKFNNLLEEKDGLVRHLQAELDEMVNLMPVDHGSSRMIDEEEVEDWLDEKSREISQYYDDGLDQIITELHGTGEREDFEEAVEEAEMSLRKVAEQAGLDEPLDKATLAAFGIRQLRTEHTLVKRLLAESEAKVKDTAELQRRGDLSEKLRVSEEQRIALQAAANEAEAAGKALTDQLDALREKLATTDQHMRTLEAETEALELKLSDSDEKAAALEDEKEALRVLVNDTKRLNDMLRGQSAEADQRRHAAADETAALRRQLAEEKAHVTAVETEAIALRHQLARWEDDAAAAAAARDAAQAQLRAVERERDTLRRQLDDAARAVVAARDADSVKRVVKELQERLKTLHETHAGCSAAAAELEARARAGEGAAQRLAAEKDFLKAELAEAVEETKAARGRFAMLLHEAAEQGARRGGGGGGEGEEGEEDPAACRRALHVIAMELERCALPAHIDVVGCGGGGDGQIAVAEGVQDPELVREIIGALRERGRVIAELDERGRRYKGAAKKHLRDAERRRARVDELAAEVRELNVRLKAERRGYDEKMGQMILALRKGE